MAYRSLEEALLDLEKAGLLRRISTEVSPDLEMAAIAREAFLNHGKALLFEKVKGSPFRAAANIFGSKERVEFLFRDTLKSVKAAIAFKADPLFILKHPRESFRLPGSGLHALFHKSFFSPVTEYTCKLSDLPAVKSWPKDGGFFLTLPQVCSLPPEETNLSHANIGMYRIQTSGNDYAEDECGLHYQIDRGIAKHHREFIRRGEKMKVSVFLGGPPAHSIAAAMPMPDNLSEAIFAGLLSGRSFRYQIRKGWVVSSDADFCILGEVEDACKEEGPFGDHLGYYSGRHPFPFMKVKKIFHKKNAIFPFTVVARPPSEDSFIGELIQDLVTPMVPVSIPGLEEINAVDSAGVHPLLLAIGRERFIPYFPREPMELQKIGHALLGFNQTALAKYVIIAAREDSKKLSTQKLEEFFTHVLERIHFDSDLHFFTSTTTDTLDYSGSSLNHGSKLLLCVAGEPCRSLGKNFSEYADSFFLPEGFSNPRFISSGILALKGTREASMESLAEALSQWKYREFFPWITVADDSDFCAQNFDNWLWVTFTRSDPAKDIYGARAHIKEKHWTCISPMLIDARMKPSYQEELTLPADLSIRARKILGIFDG